MESIAKRPQDYISNRGRTTTNTVEGYHGLALMYRDKRTDLGSYHYMCKTNMSICHKVTHNIKVQLSHVDTHMQNLGPLWKALCCSDMGVEMPASAVQKILVEQQAWDKLRSKRTGGDFRHKR